MFGILGSASDLGPVVQDCDNIDYVPLGDGTVTEMIRPTSFPASYPYRHCLKTFKTRSTTR